MSVEIYQVKSGDTLWKIAEKFYKDGFKWEQIYEYNKDVIGEDPDSLVPGMKLQIPEVNT